MDSLSFKKHLCKGNSLRMPNPAIPRGVNDGLELWPENVAHAQVGERSLIVFDLSRSIFFCI